MDPAVAAALARWPDVPAVFGWLRLDRRGQWRLRDEPVHHLGLQGFIARNYAADEHGNWYFQNGPQRVYVALDYTPWIVRTAAAGWQCHDGSDFPPPEEALLDEDGSLLLSADGRVALVDDRELPALLGLMQDARGAPLSEAALKRLICGEHIAAWLALPGGRVRLSPIRSDQIAQRFGFRPAPALPE